MHPHNKYAEKPPDFGLLASLYPSFNQYVSYAQNGRPRIDWTDFNATRELTRVLLEHDYGVKWFIPDGQLCPTVPNRANYIHWINDLLNSIPAPWHESDREQVIGIDIGTGANCIYPLLGAALHGWRFVGTDVTPVALEWARKNVQQNMSLNNLIEIRKSGGSQKGMSLNAENGLGNEMSTVPSYATSVIECGEANREQPLKSTFGHQEDSGNDVPSDQYSHKIEKIKSDHGLEEEPMNPSETSHQEYEGHFVLVGAVKDWERFDFCMCNPPFFDSIEEAAANPRTACGGTLEEMVCPGGEQSFITHIIEDSLQLKEKIHWYTTMVGRKVNLKVFIPKLRKIGATMLRTTEFVQGRTSRWGLAWSFTPVQKSHIQNTSVLRHASGRPHLSFMLEGLPRRCRADQVLQALAQHLQELGAICEVKTSSFSVSGTILHKLVDQDRHTLSQKRQRDHSRKLVINQEQIVSYTDRNDSQFSASVFEQAPGTLLVKASLIGESSSTGTFSTMFNSAEQVLKQRFCLKF